MTHRFPRAILRQTLTLVSTGALLASVACASTWQPAPCPLMTRWGKSLSPDNVWQEYPRPQMVRSQWLNLNGLWSFSMTDKDAAIPTAFLQQILVPFPVESALSGIGKRVEPKDRLWYKRTFSVPKDWNGKRTILHFEAVDWDTTVYLNGKEIIRHKGGYDPFSIDITDDIKASGTQELVVSVWDPSSDGMQPQGKQSLSPGGCFYTPSSGIWQTVWLEAVPTTYISEFRIVPDVDNSCIKVNVATAGSSSDSKLTVEAYDNGKKVAEASGTPGQPLTLSLKNPKLWTPDTPFLYTLKISLTSDKIRDKVDSYFAMRKISVGPDADGVTRILLNGKFVFQLGPLDQGFWPDGLHTPPSEEAMVYDLKTLKKLGFNMVRKHIKVEPARYYYWCDKMGMLVWQDMPSMAPFREISPQAKLQYKVELERIIGHLCNQPSIVAWVPFNESWGQFDTELIVEKIRKLDPSRLINNASGWVDKGVGDMIDAHVYPGPGSPKPEAKRAAVNGEFGGLGMNIKDHSWNANGWGYDLFQTKDALNERYEKLYRDLIGLIKNKGLSAAVYTQTTDIEAENNGLMTYDREILKIDPEVAAPAHRFVFPPTKIGASHVFIGEADVSFTADEGATIRYTTDGTEPTASSKACSAPIHITHDTVFRVKSVWPNGVSSRTATYDIRKVEPLPAKQTDGKLKPGLQLNYYEGDWKGLPELSSLKLSKIFISYKLDLAMAQRFDFYAMRFNGLIKVPSTGVYTFYISADDNSSLYIDDQPVVEDRVSHGTKELNGSVALAEGLHSITLTYSQSTGGKGLRVSWEGPGIEKSEIPEDALSFTVTDPIQCLQPTAADYTTDFVGETTARLACPYKQAIIYYTLDGSEPTERSVQYKDGIHLTDTATVRARAYLDGCEPSAVSTIVFTKKDVVKAVHPDSPKPGVLADYFTIESTEKMPDLALLKPERSYTAERISIDDIKTPENFAVRFRGYISVPADGVYGFWLDADDQAVLTIDDQTLAKARFDDAYIGIPSRLGVIPLQAGMHRISLQYLQNGGRKSLGLHMQGPKTPRRQVERDMLFN